ncbi:calcium-dependent cysteine protease, putative, partial [Ixodes scapularis]
LQKKELFEDPEFQCKDYSVFGNKEPNMNISWKRPKEIHENPVFSKDGFSRFDVKQGSLGNCWVVASTAILTIHKDLFNRVVPSGQSFEDGKYAGIFHFVMWKDNRWVDVVVDDRLPVDEDGDLVFMTSNTKEEFWSSLLEKAYAKLHGSYTALEGGSGIESMAVYTGGLTEQIMLDKPPKNLFKLMEKAFERSSLLTCSNIVRTQLAIESFQYALGGIERDKLIRATSYQVMATDGQERQLIRLRNPWGSEEWKGAWSD